MLTCQHGVPTMFPAPSSQQTCAIKVCALGLWHAIQPERRHGLAGCSSDVRSIKKQKGLRSHFGSSRFGSRYGTRCIAHPHHVSSVIVLQSSQCPHQWSMRGRDECPPSGSEHSPVTPWFYGVVPLTKTTTCSPWRSWWSPQKPPSLPRLPRPLVNVHVYALWELLKRWKCHRFNSLNAFADLTQDDHMFARRPLHKTTKKGLSRLTGHLAIWIFVVAVGFRLQSMRSTVTDGRVYTAYTSYASVSMLFYTTFCGWRRDTASKLVCA